MNEKFDETESSKQDTNNPFPDDIATTPTRPMSPSSPKRNKDTSFR